MDSINDNSISLDCNLSIKEMNEELIKAIENCTMNLRPWEKIDDISDDSNNSSNSDDSDDLNNIECQFQMAIENESMPDYSEDERIIFNSIVSKEKYLLTLYFDKPPVLSYFTQDLENIFYSKECDEEDIKDRLVRQSFNEYNNFYDICDIISIEDIDDEF